MLDTFQLKLLLVLMNDLFSLFRPSDERRFFGMKLLFALRSFWLRLSAFLVIQIKKVKMVMLFLHDKVFIPSKLIIELSIKVEVREERVLNFLRVKERGAKTNILDDMCKKKVQPLT